MSVAIRLRADALRTTGYAAIATGNGSYVPVGTPFGQPMRMLLFQNFTDVALYFSFTGNTDHFVLPSNGQFILDICTNQSFEQGFYVMVGTQIWVTSIGSPAVNPMLGAVYVSSFYAV